MQYAMRVKGVPEDGEVLNDSPLLSFFRVLQALKNVGMMTTHHTL